MYISRISMCSEARNIWIRFIQNYFYCYLYHFNNQIHRWDRGKQITLNCMIYNCEWNMARFTWFCEIILKKEKSILLIGQDNPEHILISCKDTLCIGHCPWASTIKLKLSSTTSIILELKYFVDFVTFNKHWVFEAYQRRNLAKMDNLRATDIYQHRARFTARW